MTKMLNLPYKFIGFMKKRSFRILGAFYDRVSIGKDVDSTLIWLAYFIAAWNINCFVEITYLKDSA